MTLFRPDPRDRDDRFRCRRDVRVGNHTWRDLPPNAHVCVWCGRRFGRRYR